ncbi:MAG TPA: serine hydrolase domain-containing protein, partial [Acidobacteriaceae bacterium]|nr:serine hydrolase domain-containing protein [Acidobacteriaceae bacterium]
MTTALLEQAVHDRVFPGCAFAVLAIANTQTPEQSAHVVGHAVGRFTYEPYSPPVEADTIFDLASLTKVIATTAAIMRLYDRGELALDVPVAEWLPEFAASNASDTRRSLITPRMLLDHSSGLPGYARLFESANDRLAMIDACLHQPLTADPGTRAEYSDIGFMILGHLIETITGE